MLSPYLSFKNISKWRSNKVLGRLETLGPGGAEAAGRRWQVAELERHWRSRPTPWPPVRATMPGDRDLQIIGCIRFVLYIFIFLVNRSFQNICLVWSPLTKRLFRSCILVRAAPAASGKSRSWLCSQPVKTAEAPSLQLLHRNSRIHLFLSAK